MIWKELGTWEMEWDNFFDVPFDTLIIISVSEYC